MDIGNFIWCKDGALTPDACLQIVQYFSELEAVGLTRTRQQQDSRILKLHMDDTSVCVAGENVVGRLSSVTLMDVVNSAIWQCVNEYADKYDALKNAAQLMTYDIKIQKTPVGGGYHIWHFETDSLNTSGRILTYIIYINDVEEGGETEFLYLHKRIKAQAGRLILFPGSFTHTHRGNQPLSNEKYVITGFVEF